MQKEIEAIINTNYYKHNQQTKVSLLIYFNVKTISVADIDPNPKGTKQYPKVTIKDRIVIQPERAKIQIVGNYQTSSSLMDIYTNIQRMHINQDFARQINKITQNNSYRKHSISFH
ncbi:unnamed protein product [Paramecium octaurelia]|uniref:Uncharacterized protein n=1 Tax=Paramecium octaurelia TaxID=43137 RepID=A0A8S1UDI3_PAROT|nr:unnamed protein product [Paramecium octaurelia]